ncbi:MAG: serine hydrolase domain-containing protein [Bacteroidota bacterium]
MIRFTTALKSVVVIIFLGVVLLLPAQELRHLADSLRVKYNVPELAYAVVSADEVMDLSVLGVKKTGSDLTAQSADRFRIGSNTKAITGYIAALLVNEGKLSWDTQFFEMFPELKKAASRAYHRVTLLELLTFRTRLYPYTYTYDEPRKEQFSGSETEQRYQFSAWFFQQPPVKKKEINFSNLGYVAAAMMMEKASGKTYKQLVTDLGEQLNISFGFGNAVAFDPGQPWGHDSELNPVGSSPSDYKLEWLLAAGNINVSLPDYVKFIQLQLAGLAGRNNQMTKSQFEFLHYGLPRFSVGWFQGVDENERRFSYNIGNPGTFYSKVMVFGEAGIAIIILTNAQTAQTEKGVEELYELLKQRYIR